MGNLEKLGQRYYDWTYRVSGNNDFVSFLAFLILIVVMFFGVYSLLLFDVWLIKEMV